MKRIIPQTLLDQLFRVGVSIKGLDGVIEILGGSALLAVPVSRLHGFLLTATYELTEDKHAFIAHTLSLLDHKLTPGLALFAALYLIGHGAIKVFLAIALLRQHYRIYPLAIIFLLLFIFYQSYRVGYDHSVWLAGLTAFDAIVTWLTYLEWRRHTPSPLLDQVTLPGPDPRSPRVRRLVLFVVVGFALVTSGVAVAMAWPEPKHDTPAAPLAPHMLGPSLADLKHQIGDFEDKQAAAHVELTSNQSLQTNLANIETEIRQKQYDKASRDIRSAKDSLAGLTTRLGSLSKEAVHGTPAPAAAGERLIPIVLYHYTPTNFDQQLAHLEQHGYTAVDLGQVAAALSGGGSLPAKPVVITFDDGFANQTVAFDILKAHHMKATFYIINGGEASKWCIGAGRRYHDPLQPPQGCGDAYLTWDQVRELDRSGLITIGGHTLDHLNLASLPPDQQRHEIIDSKHQIEQEIGHPIHDFAYPYGNYNASAIAVVQEAGYSTAVTVMPGEYQSAGQLYTLRRIRDTLNLP